MGRGNGKKKGKLWWDEVKLFPRWVQCCVLIIFMGVGSIFFFFFFFKATLATKLEPLR